jgi:hypothetical protein
VDAAGRLGNDDGKENNKQTSNIVILARRLSSLSLSPFLKHFHHFPGMIDEENINVDEKGCT